MPTCDRSSSAATTRLGVDGRACPVETIVASVPWGSYLGKEGLENGVDVQVSTWRRMAPDTLNALAKIGGQYVNSQNIVMEARDNGFAEGIALDINGYVSEGSGENIFLIIKGQHLSRRRWAAASSAASPASVRSASPRRWATRSRKP